MQRCAIYTRKSTEDGLEQDFNSLHAQREACEAYIKSQRQEGWRLVQTAFDDGGYSGGTLVRPAIQELLAAVIRHEVDIIIVYKVDRLTRSLGDFSKIIEQLDAHGVSFVSVTQQFNTTSSMGRLTLNVLLSFAQFEREVTAERIRDKIAASKKKGIWMGGQLPLGYDVDDRKLVINKIEAATIQKIFNLYIELRTVRLLGKQMIHLKITTKQHVRKNGLLIGNKPFSRGSLYRLLSNPLYIGRVPHKGETYPGQHKAIIDQETWSTVQRILADNTRNRSLNENTRAPFLLTRLIFDANGEPLYQSQAKKKEKRYHYYISKQLMHDAHLCDSGWRLPAKTLETAVIEIILELLGSQSRLMDLLLFTDHAPSNLKILRDQSIALTNDLVEGEPSTKKKLLQSIIQRINLSSKSISIDLKRWSLAKTLDVFAFVDSSDHADTITIKKAISLRRRGVEAKLVIEGNHKKLQEVDPHLCRLIAQAKLWFDQLASGEANSVQDIARQEKVFDTEISRILPLAFLAPAIVEDILHGRQPENLGINDLKRLSSLPTNWEEQRKRLGFST